MESSASTCLRQQLLDAPGSVQVHQALVALNDEAGPEGAQPQLRNGAVVQHLQGGRAGQRGEGGTGCMCLCLNQGE